MKGEQGFSIVEAVISLAVGSLLIFSFYDLYNATINLSQESLERAYAYNMAIRYLDQRKHDPASRDGVVIDNTSYSSPNTYQPEARGYYHVVNSDQPVVGTQYNYNYVTVDYGYKTSNRPSVTVGMYIRYYGGMFY